MTIIIVGKVKSILGILELHISTMSSIQYEISKVLSFHRKGTGVLSFNVNGAINLKKPDITLNCFIHCSHMCCLES